MAFTRSSRLVAGFTAACALLVGPGALAETLDGNIVDIVDADTLLIDIGGSKKIVHLFGIDAPEPDQPFGNEANAITRQFVGREAAIDVVAASGNELVGRVTVGDTDLGLALTDAGFAWIAEEGVSDDRYVVSILSARYAPRGLWVEPDPMHPFRWRRDHPIVSETNAPELADIAGTVNLERDANGRVIIDSTDIPSRFARYAEGELFVDRMIAVAEVSAWIEQADGVWQTHCADTSTTRADGSIWSQRLGAWVSTSSAPQGCDELNKQITDAERWMIQARQVAMSDAVRGGISKADIRTVSEALNLDD